MKRLFFFFVSCVSIGIAQENPGVVWWSTPVEPGETVQLHGGAWGSNTVVELVSGGDTQASFARAERLIPLKKTETGLAFEFPRTWKPGLATFRVVSEQGASAPHVLNEPETWWIQGDLGAAATPGGWVRFFGRCLDREQGAEVKLVDAKGKERALKLTLRDVWSLEAQLPSDFPMGAYTAYVSNGSGRRAGWRKAGAFTVCPEPVRYKPERFDVTAFGAIANDGLDDTVALQAALAAAATNGGGVVYLPRGRFQCNGTLVIPTNTLLRGLSRDLSQLYWMDCENPPEALIEGSSSFGIEDLMIHAGKYRSGIVCKNAIAKQHELSSSRTMLGHDISFRRMTLKLIIDQYILKNTVEYEKRAYLPGNGIVARDVRNLRMEDCDIYCSKEGSSTLYFVCTGEYVHISGCRINGSGWAVVGGDKVIFEKNDAWNCTYSVSSVSRNLYWGKNRQYDLFTNNREAITHDGAKVAFKDTASAVCSGTQMKLIFDGTPAYQNGPTYWKGYDVQIVEGKGAGQTRGIVAINAEGTEITLDQPWLIQPDQTSRFVVAAERKHLLYVDNYTEDSSIAIQLYGGLTDGVLARNTCTRSGGFRGFGMVYHKIIPRGFVQYFDNRIISGNGYRGPSNEIPPRDSVFEFTDKGRPGLTLTRSCVMRRCLGEGNAYVLMDSANGVVEQCTIRHADCGICSGRHAASLVVRNNTLEEVKLPYDAAVRSGAFLDVAQVASDMLASATLELGAQAPAAWTTIQAQLKKMRAQDATPQHAENVRRLVESALRALGNSETVFNQHLAELLMGMTIRVRDWDRTTEEAFAKPASKTFQIPLQVTMAEQGFPVTVSLAGEACGGWTFGALEKVSLKPGTTALSLPAVSPAGGKGYFQLPILCTFVGDGWRLRCRYYTTLLTENRTVGWLVAKQSGTAKPQEWKMPTYNAHGEIEAEKTVGKLAANEVAVGLSLLRVTTPVSINFTFHGGADFYLDGQRLGSELARGSFATCVLQPGDHLLRAEVQPNAKQREAAVFRANCRVSNAVHAGDFYVVPAEELMQMKNVLK